ncbi:hypothetical protein J6590_020243 [Homalodisca vitripennis]|nr:hypothetical protein J6590_020243 [Homalodisca vitripennis]
MLLYSLHSKTRILRTVWAVEAANLAKLERVLGRVSARKLILSRSLEKFRLDLTNRNKPQHVRNGVTEGVMPSYGTAVMNG